MLVWVEKAFDKCFVLISSASFTHTISGRDQTQLSKELWNAIEQREIGSYYSIVNDLNNLTCLSLSF
jgi:hypothetical protein